jgi:hypothetical protein
LVFCLECYHHALPCKYGFYSKGKTSNEVSSQGESGNNDLSFSVKSYDEKVGQEDKEVSAKNEKENKQEPSTSHLQLCVLVNSEEISESEALVAEVDEESETIVPLGRKRNIQILPKQRNHLQRVHSKQPSLRMSTKMVSPITSTSLFTRVEKSTKKPPIKRKSKAYSNFET